MEELASGWAKVLGELGQGQFSLRYIASDEAQDKVYILVELY